MDHQIHIKSRAHQINNMALHGIWEIIMVHPAHTLMIMVPPDIITRTMDDPEKNMDLSDHKMTSEDHQNYKNLLHHKSIGTRF